MMLSFRSVLRHQKVGFIGFGQMAQALAEAWLNNEVLSPGDIIASNPSKGKMLKFQEIHPIDITQDNEMVLQKSNIVILAMKPQHFLEAMEPLRSQFREEQFIFSILAGLSVRQLKRFIDINSVFRVMPNLPCRVGKGFFICHSPEKFPNKELFKNVIHSLFSPLGSILFVKEEDRFNALSVVASCGPGFLFEIMQYWQEWILDLGLSDEESRNLTLRIFEGATCMGLHWEKVSFSDLVNKVASKKGITQAGLKIFREMEMESLFKRAFEQSLVQTKKISESLS